MKKHRYDDQADWVEKVFIAVSRQHQWIREDKRTEEVTWMFLAAAAGDLSETIVVSVDRDSGILEVGSRLLKNMSAGKRPEAAIIINEYNLGRLLGMLEMDFRTGEVWYKIKLSIAGCRIRRMVAQRILEYLIRETDRYRDLLIQLDSERMTLEQILQRME